MTALAGALASTLAAAAGITNKCLRALMTGLLPDPAYTPGQMTYDLRRLRLVGLIRRIEHTNWYVLTPDEIKFAVFYTSSATAPPPAGGRRPGPSTTTTPAGPGHHHPARR